MLLLCLASCKQKDDAPIPPKKMEAILTDLHIAEAYSMTLDDSLHRAIHKNIDSLAVYYRDVMAHHNVSEAELRESLEWYKNNVKDFDSTYSAVNTQLTAIEDKMNKK
jgi:hypothetical protein